METKEQRHYTRRNVVLSTGKVVGVASGVGYATVPAVAQSGTLYIETIDEGFSFTDETDLEFYSLEQGTVFEDTIPEDEQEYDLSQVPNGGEFILHLEHGSTYHPLRIFIPDLDSDLTAYFLHDGQDVVSSQFQINDYTGSFPNEETVLHIEAPHEASGSFVEYISDTFGATGEFEVDLREGTRHRLSLTNYSTGEERHLGAITPNTSQLYTLDIRPDRVEIVEEEAPTISVRPSTRTLLATEGATIDVEVGDRGSEIDEWTVDVTYENGTTESLYQDTIPGPDGGSVSPEFDLSDKEGGSVLVDVAVDVVDGGTVTRQVTYSVRESHDHDNSLLSVLGSWGEELSSDGASGGTTTFVAVLLSVVLTGAVAARIPRASAETLGGVAVASIAGFAVVGWIPYGLLFAAGVTYGTLWAIARGI